MVNRNQHKVLPYQRKCRKWDIDEHLKNVTRESKSVCGSIPLADSVTYSISLWNVRTLLCNATVIFSNPNLRTCTGVKNESKICAGLKKYSLYV